MENNTNITQQPTQPVLETKNNQSKFDLAIRWFILVFLFLHILFFSWETIDVLSTYQFFSLSSNEIEFIIIGLIAFTLFISSFFGILKNKIWGYILIAPVAVVSVLFALSIIFVIKLAIVTSVYREGQELMIYFHNYLRLRPIKVNCWIIIRNSSDSYIFGVIRFGGVVDNTHIFAA